MTYIKRVEATKANILLKHPEANIIGVGSNNLLTGIWFVKNNSKKRMFTPLISG